MPQDKKSLLSRWWVWALAAVVVLAAVALFLRPKPADVRIGSKAFTESAILGEIFTLMARKAGVTADHRAGLGGTQVVWGALLKGEIDAYVDYTGTIRRETLARENVQTDEKLRQVLAGKYDVKMSKSLGFENSYAIGMKQQLAAKLGIKTISDLRKHPTLKFGFGVEFMDREDGWPGLRSEYQLPQTNVVGMEHALAYQSIDSGEIAATDLYTTDAKIRSYNLALLKDDQRFFPEYKAVLLYRSDLEERYPGVVKEFLRLQGKITTEDMQEMNEKVEVNKRPNASTAYHFLLNSGLVTKSDNIDLKIESMAERMLHLTWQHLFLVGVSLLGAIVVAVPLGMLASYFPRLGQFILTGTGILQTIPSIALLTLMIPLFGIGAKPAIVALFLYSLLPIVRNTHAGLSGIPVSIRESAEALGLPGMARLRLIEFPLAARTILAGIKTAAVINVGTAALGGFIGAGGYGSLIFTGLYKGDNALILEGAIPTANMALLIQGVFEIAERFVVPMGLRLKPSS